MSTKPGEVDPGPWSYKSLDFDGDSGRILTLRYGWTDHGGLVTLVALSHVPAYIMIAEKALHLNQLGMNPNRIAVALDVDRTTVVRALRWIKGKPKYHTRGFKDP